MNCRCIWWTVLPRKTTTESISPYRVSRRHLSNTTKTRNILRSRSLFTLIADMSFSLFLHIIRNPEVKWAHVMTSQSCQRWRWPIGAFFYASFNVGEWWLFSAPSSTDRSDPEQVGRFNDIGTFMVSVTTLIHILG